MGQFSVKIYGATGSVLNANQQALSKLLENLSTQGLPETVISQSFMGLEFGEISTDPINLMEAHINRCVSRYFEAAGYVR